MIPYSPFDKSLNELEAADLEVLTRTNEGWHVEYKGEVPKAPVIAKSVSSFANTQGGWLFYGIEEKSKADTVAGSFPGIARADVDGCWQSIQQAVPGNTTPPPHFDMKVVWGPCDAIGLPADRAVFCTHVPWSAAAPHVHRDARIYRRVGDQSDPKPENDRFLLDQLWRRADTIKQNYKNWIERDQGFSDVEKNTLFVRLLFVPDRWGHRGLWIKHSISEVRELLKAPLPYELHFDTVHTSANGFVARQKGGGDPCGLGLTWRLFMDFSSDILIPFSVRMPSDKKFLFKLMPEFGDDYVHMLTKQGFTTPRIVNFDPLFWVLPMILGIYNRILVDAQWKEGFFYKVQVLNAWRTCPFLDAPFVFAAFLEHSVPVCLDKEILSPPGTDPEDFVCMPGLTELQDVEAQSVWQGMMLFNEIATVYGLPQMPYEDDQIEVRTKYCAQLVEAAQRYILRQQKREERN